MDGTGLYEGQISTEPKTIELDLSTYFDTLSTSADESKALKIIIGRLQREDQKIWRELSCH